MSSRKGGGARETYLGRDGVTSRGEQLRDTRSVQTGLCKTKSSPQACASRAAVP